MWPLNKEHLDAERWFHRRVVKLSRNEELSRITETLQVGYLTLMLRSVSEDEGGAIRRSSPTFSHLDAAEAIASGDSQKAHDVMWAQFDTSMAYLERVDRSRRVRPMRRWIMFDMEEGFEYVFFSDCATTGSKPRSSRPGDPLPADPFLCLFTLERRGTCSSIGLRDLWQF